MAVFIVFEGGDGAGKTTQCRLLATTLRSTGRMVIVTHEPGGTDPGEHLRRLLLTAPGRLSPTAEILGFALDRAIHVDEVIRPALAAGNVVICDRFVDSSIAYQGYGHPPHDPRPVADLNTFATGGLVPDLVVLLDIDPIIGLRRGSGTADHIESRTLTYHQRVREGFLALAAADPDRYVVLDATNQVGKLAALIAWAVRERADTLTDTPPVEG